MRVPLDHCSKGHFNLYNEPVLKQLNIKAILCKHVFLNYSWTSILSRDVTKAGFYLIIFLMISGFIIAIKCSKTKNPNLFIKFF